jgi:hypothetical protein
MVGFMKLESYHSSEEKGRWKIVRTDSYADVPGAIVSADELTGECNLQVGPEVKALTFGPGGIKIVEKRR